MASSRRQYPFHLIEPKWQQAWDAQQTFRAWNPGDELPTGHPFASRHHLSGKVTAGQLPPKYYILDMFPYPSGAGLHVGHPEGYTATDILARYRRALGFNVLHPMGWDSFGLPAEQYAVQTGQHPRKTTEANIANFTRQIKSLGFSYDWTRELATTDPEYFAWTQWIFLKLYNSYFDAEKNCARPISELIGNRQSAIGNEPEAEQRDYIDSRRLAFISEAPVNWCPELGTVLANEEVIDGKSERGGFPVIRKPMRQWMLRITAYAERLIADLDTIEWTDSLKEMQRNWIGRSEGAEVDFPIADSKIRVFTTRPDTLFGATYMVLSPEHKLVAEITTPEQKQAVEDYKKFAAGKSDLERTELAKEKTGVFTGAYAINPVNGEKIPIWIADYVLASYGTGAIMAVPAHDERDFEFATKFQLPVRVVIEPPAQWLVEASKRFLARAGEPADIYHGTLAEDHKAGLLAQYVAACETFEPFVGEGVAMQSAKGGISLDGLGVAEAKKKITAWLEEKGLGKKTINYKLRDWLFSRQRYWGEPFPIVWKKDAAGNLHHEALPTSALPLLPPTLEDYKPTAGGEPPLARARDWVTLPDGSTRETNTMPQWAGSCWYYLRYLDAKNHNVFVGKEAEYYWMGASSVSVPANVNSPHTTTTTIATRSATKPGVDLYVGGIEHAVLHLLYARFWHKVLFDLGYVSTAEPFYKLVNQGLILGEMEFTRFAFQNGELVSAAKIRDITEEVTSTGLLLVGFHKDTGEKVFGQRIGPEAVEAKGHGMVLRADPQIVVDGRSSKMSKSRGNVVNPDDMVKEFGADALRLYEMFMGPLQDVKPWNTQGVAGVYKFLGRVWRLFVDEKSETTYEQAETLTAENAEERKDLLDLILLDGSIADQEPLPAQLKALHACIKKVTEDLDAMRFNTAISAMMVFVNESMTWQAKPLAVMKTFLQLLAPFAPHLAEELWARLHSTFGQVPPSLTYAVWPVFDPTFLIESEIEIPVQVNGKFRDVIKVAVDADNATIEAAAKAAEKAQPFLADKTIKKVIIVPKKMVNLIVA